MCGSIAEIESRSGQKVTDLHRPYIDEITFPCSCGATMKRIPEVLDCWFESGSMPYGQDHWMKQSVALGAHHSPTKRLSFQERMVQHILTGKKTKTFRLGDKKYTDLQVGDVISLYMSLLDGSDEQHPFAYAKVIATELITFDKIPLITTGHESYQSVQDKLITFKRHYGRDIADDEMISAIEFEVVEHDTQHPTDSDPTRVQVFSPTADFIAEGLDQTRGRFRSLHVLGQAYMDAITFRNVVVTGMILAQDGKKMSKSKKNYPDPRGLLEQYGADAFRVYLLGSPVVRAEPLRFSEKGVEQVLKDFVIPLQNVWNFFETYANVDAWKATGTEVYFMRHAHKAAGEGEEQEQIPLSDEGKAYLQSEQLREHIIRLQPDLVICSPYLRCRQTMEGVQAIMQAHTTKHVDYQVDDRLMIGNPSIGYLMDELRTTGKRVLLISHKVVFDPLWKHLLGSDPTTLHYGEIVRLPSSPRTNELDQWILAATYEMLAQVDDALACYEIERATKAMLSLVDSLTNWYVRRSRRRFRSE